MSSPPGTIVAHSPASSEAYIGSPALLILPDGSYVASHDFFGPGTDFDEYAVYRSENRGQTWSKIAGFIGQWWSSLFLHGGDLYTIGTTREYGYAVIRRSTDAGYTWTDAVDSSTGILSPTDRYHCAPVPVIEHENRIWTAYEIALGRRPHWPATVASAPVGADLLDAGNWTWAEPYHHHRSRGQWIEGNMVVGPDGRLVNVLRSNPRVDGKRVGDRAALVHVSCDGKRLTHNAPADEIHMPGGGVKFTIRFDIDSGRYWTLGSKQTRPAAVRNTLVLASSADLRKWTVEQTLLHHADPAHHGFHYVDWVVEGDDLLFLSRTAFADGLGGAHTQHDANYLTFHRVLDFRSPDQSVT